jgi:hypothetical protein
VILEIAYRLPTGMEQKRYLESLGDCGTIKTVFFANGFVLPSSVRRSPDFDTDRPGFETIRPDFGKHSLNFETASPTFRAVPPISKSTAPFLKTVPPVSADVPPDLKTSPPIFGVFPRFYQPFPRFFGRRNVFGNLFPAAIYTDFNPKLTKN